MRKTNNPSLRNYAQNLRCAMTKEERHLWYDFLKNLPVIVHRQKVIGAYILDFYIPSDKLAIELDGAPHFSYANHQYDEGRTKFLQNLGITVLRYTNYDISSRFSWVCYDISTHINSC